MGFSGSRSAEKQASGTNASLEVELPLRAALFSSEEMGQYGPLLARNHRIGGKPTDRLLRRLKDNERMLVRVHDLLVQSLQDDEGLTPAAEWLLDNFYIIEEQVQTAKRHFPRKYSRQLPSLTPGPSAGLPRVYDIALEVVSHGDGRLDVENLRSLLQSYQSVSSLKMGELWAIPIMLRLALIENLRRVAARIAHYMEFRSQANQWAEKMIQVAATDPGSLILTTGDMARSDPPLVNSFVAELSRRLQGQGSRLSLPIAWIEQRLGESGQSIEQMIRAESHQQAADQVSVGNSFASLRLLAGLDWQKFVESISTIDQILEQDPSNTYSNTTFATRDDYRHVVEKLARQSGAEEVEIARNALALSRQAGQKNQDRAAGHIGYYLTGAGRCALERTLPLRFSLWRSILSLARKFPLLLYAGTILLLSGAITSGLMLQARAPVWLLVPLGIAVFLGASQLSMALINRLASLTVKPTRLPAMDFSRAIPKELRTLVVVPAMLSDAAGIQSLVEALEIRYLGNRDPNLMFALITDFLDADEKTRPEDEKLLDLARSLIAGLNNAYDEPGKGPFFLLHRNRRWNAMDRIWMGYERKRGKIATLNAYLKGQENSFDSVTGNTALLNNIKYVITLDSDTTLPRDAARKLVGAMAHPLNHPVLDPEKRMVVRGYGILQPGVEPGFPLEAHRSRYSSLNSQNIGIDPYTRTVSDIYQDLFGEGSFTGKGIYDLDAMETVLFNRLPENRILSHDLIEGCYLRSGLLSDVQLYEPYPTLYSTDVKRRHRWIRGDWQIGRWIFPAVPGYKKRFSANPLSALSRFKLLDNLRRSLTPPALLFVLLSSWFFLPGAHIWTAAVGGMLLIPALLSAGWNLMHKPADTPLSSHIKSAFGAALGQARLAVLSIATLPHETYYSLDAILRTLWRLNVSRRNLLQWSPTATASSSHAAEFGTPSTAPASRRSRPGFAGTLLPSWSGTLVALPLLMGLVYMRPGALGTSIPVIALWMAAPALLYWITRPWKKRPPERKASDELYLRKLARKTYSYFETFSTAADHFLTPDNFQEDTSVVAHRTSPTNMGLALLANLSAYDMGYLTLGDLIQRTERSLDSMDGLEKYRGHFYNWYDTTTLQPLPPLYVSTVDSGNLAGHLLTLKAGLLALIQGPTLPPRWFQGLCDTFQVLIKASSDTDQNSNSKRRAGKTTGLDLEQPGPSLEPTGLDLEHRGSRSQFYKELESKLKEYAILECPSPVQTVSFLSSVTELARNLQSHLDMAQPDDAGDSWWTETFLHQCQSFLRDIESSELQSSRNLEPGNVHAPALQRLADQCHRMSDMDFRFLYNPSSRLLTIGYNVTDSRTDNSYYDLLASEARLASFVAISRDQIPQESWFALGRLITPTSGDPALLSWTGSMFEYLMPLLVMPDFSNTLLSQTYRSVVARQIEYGRRRGVPWGVSESGYNAIDAQLNYQYRAFGIPGLGLKRGLADDLVITPYASALALMVDPTKACNNLKRLSAEGMEGRFGLFEARDYTPSRLPVGQIQCNVQSYMAHHQGMTLVALSHTLLDRPMQRRFESEPLFQATMLLLQERIPGTSPAIAHTSGTSEYHRADLPAEAQFRTFSSPHTHHPELQLLSNGSYHVMVTQAGGGYSRWRNLAVTRWKEDTTCDDSGSFCYIRDLKTGKYWSTGLQPTRKQPEGFEAVFSEGRAEFRGHNHGFETRTEIAVSAEDDIELRRIQITNHGREARSIDLTSYAEVVLAPAAADAQHSTFSNLFVETEIVPAQKAILCHRRPRSEEDEIPYLFHQMVLTEGTLEEIYYETDRLRFQGRDRTLADPVSMDRDNLALSGTMGSVLDPIVSIRNRVTISPDESITVQLITGIGQSREEALRLAGKYQDRGMAHRVFDLAWTHRQVILKQLNASESDAQLYARLAGSIVYSNDSLRAPATTLLRNRRGQSGLWGFSISGDLPIILLKIESATSMDLVRDMVRAHTYWRLKGLAVDLVIWNEDHAGYRQLMHDQILDLIATTSGGQILNRPGGIFLRPGDQIGDEDRILIETVARAILSDRHGSVAEQLNAAIPMEQHPTPLIRQRVALTEDVSRESLIPAGLIHFNGTGGFNQEGNEYVMVTDRMHCAPAPWVNVLSNPNFGTVISQSGTSYSWKENAHEFRITPWGNDPVGDSGGEAIYLRDEESGLYWSATPLPACGNTPYITRHGFGYSLFEHTEQQIESELMYFVAMDAPVKFAVLKIRNRSRGPRKISATSYVEWVLGDLRSKTGMHVITSVDPVNGSLCARNPYNDEFRDSVAFLDVDDTSRTITGDRGEFLGRNGSMERPAAMDRVRLSGRSGAGLDPCGAIQVSFELEAGQEKEIIFRLGVGANQDDVRRLVNRLRGHAAMHTSLDIVHKHWTRTLGSIKVQTPDPSFDVLTNGWLLYQTIACRMWARSATYQSGGAFGFRDQLQDSMALLHCRPHILRQHLLLCASRQFPEGDVQHWWHPPEGRGVRTLCSDDYLWLALATARYVMGTGDTGVLDEPVHFLTGRSLNPGEESYYDLPGRSEERSSLYDHCVRAIRHGLSFGEHGLPLMGSGDWNDGMDRVGLAGKGESVWLAFFLYEVLRTFSEVAAERDESFAEFCRTEAETLQTNIEKSGWDGQWWRRAYFDDGTALGSAESPECQIDSISQSWAVLSGAGHMERNSIALESLEKHLVSRTDGLVKLLAPPFDGQGNNPGYIRGYAPGVRENGGQYTHAAVWAAMAFARVGDSAKCYDLFSMINPINHSTDPESANKYKVEPYVMAADVYSVSPHTGRGGWTWYTGSSAWMYRLAVESILGLQKIGNNLHVRPCIPESWDGFELVYRFEDTEYRIVVVTNRPVEHSAAENTVLDHQTNGLSAFNGSLLTLDGILRPDLHFPLVNDHQPHLVELQWNRPEP